MVRRFHRVGRIAVLLLPLALAACQTFIKSPGSCEDGFGPDGCPHTICDPKVLHKPTVHAAASDLDHLEKHIDWHGSVVAKVPDVWGQARLTLYREQFEAEMVKELDQFSESLQGSIARQDQAFLLSATSLSASLETPVRPYRFRVLPAGRYFRGLGENSNLPLPTKDDKGKDTNNIVVLDRNETVLVTPDESNANRPPAAPLPGLVTNAAGTALEPSSTGFFFTSPGINPANFRSQFLSQTGDSLKIGLEPERYLEQKKRYLDLLAQIRRSNEGDDTADAPGYDLRLMRIPVSLLPGKRTDKGHGAEITMTLAPVLGDDLLPTTFRGLVINDLVYQLGFPITQVLSERSEELKDLITPRVGQLVETVALLSDYLVDNQVQQAHELMKNVSRNSELHADLQASLGPNDWKIIEQLKNLNPTSQIPVGRPLEATRDGLTLKTVGEVAMRDWSKTQQATPREQVKIAGRRFNAAQTSLRKGLAAGIAIPTLSFAPGTDSRTALPTSQLVDVYGTAYSFEIALGVRNAFEKSVQRQNYAHLPDVQAFLKEELNAAYDLLSNPRNQALWDFCTPELVHAVRTQAYDQLDKRRRAFRQMVAQLAASGPDKTDRTDPAQLSRSAAFAWAILIDTVLLTDKMCKDMKSAASARNVVVPGAADWLPLFLPCPPTEARMTFNHYVRVRWPIHVFALDPAIQEQNLADRLSTRRELQLALSLAFSHGFMNFNQLTRYARRLEADYETIDLNRTQIGFSHGPDTFGWRFYPRFQTPDTPGNLTVITRDLLLGGPNRNQLLRERRLEPGPRECVALVIMPSFVPAVQIDTTSNFFGLVNPKHKVFDHTQAVKLGRTVQAIKNTGGGLTDTNCYRDGDAARLVKRAEQLEARLPLQTMTFQVPTEGSLGGFELFNTSTTSLSPELFGWYGAPGVDSTKKTTLFLVGDHFSPLRTRVIVGNKAITKDSAGTDGTPKLTMLSRQVVQVDFGPEFIPLNASHVTIHVATPYGVSRELIVPLVNTGATDPDGYYLTHESTLNLGYKLAPVPNTNPAQFTAQIDFVSAGAGVIRGRFASGVVPEKVKVEIDGLSGSYEVTAKKPGEYPLDGADFASLVQAWFAKYAANKQFGSAAEVERELPRSMSLMVTPITGTISGTTQKVYGLLPVTVKQVLVAPAPATGFNLKAMPKPIAVRVELEAVENNRFKTKTVTPAAPELVIQPVPAKGAPTKVKVHIAGFARTVEIEGKDGAFVLKEADFNTLIQAWVNQYIAVAQQTFASKDAADSLIPKKFLLQVTPSAPNTGDVMNLAVIIVQPTVTEPKKDPPPMPKEKKE